jgi:hypothetical protein
VYGEALAAMPTKLASVLASSLHLQKFILEGDSSIDVLALQNPALRLDWHFEHLINETLSSFLVSYLWESRKINRNANICAHYVAYRAVARVPRAAFPHSPPP